MAETNWSNCWAGPGWRSWGSGGSRRCRRLRPCGGMSSGPRSSRPWRSRTTGRIWSPNSTPSGTGWRPTRASSVATGCSSSTSPVTRAGDGCGSGSPTAGISPESWGHDPGSRSSSHCPWTGTPWWAPRPRSTRSGSSPSTGSGSDARRPHGRPERRHRRSGRPRGCPCSRGRSPSGSCWTRGRTDSRSTRRPRRSCGPSCGRGPTTGCTAPCRRRRWTRHWPIRTGKCGPGQLRCNRTSRPSNGPAYSSVSRTNGNGGSSPCWPPSAGPKSPRTPAGRSPPTRPHACAPRPPVSRDCPPLCRSPWPPTPRAVCGTRPASLPGRTSTPRHGTGC